MSATLVGRELILGVTGSIAAYKAAYLLREVTRLGARVTVCLTENAQHFVGGENPDPGGIGQRMERNDRHPSNLSAQVCRMPVSSGAVDAPTVARAQRPGDFPTAL